MKICFLQGLGKCSGKISREHYISKTVLEAISSSGAVQIGGLPWQSHQTLQNIGIKSLASKILCETHNSGLSQLDSVAGMLFQTLDAADKNPSDLPAITSVDGPLVERWFIKVLCGLAGAVGFNNGVVPDQWKSILTGNPWPDGWGLYVPAASEPQVLATEFYMETHVHPETRSVLAATFRVAGVGFHVLLGRPDNPEAWGTHRPRGIIFRDQKNERRIEFVWPFQTEQTVIYTKLGMSKERPPQWDGWTE